MGLPLIAWQILFVQDYLLLPFFAIFWMVLFRFIRNQRYQDKQMRRYFSIALSLRLLGAMLTAFMYQLYYGYGDTFFYYFGARDVFNALLSDPRAAFEMLFVDYYDWSLDTYNKVTLRGFFLKSKEVSVIQFAGIVSPLGLGTYIGTSFAMTIFSFLGSWAIYRVFYNLYPHRHKALAFAILYLPSLWFWSTGIMKESIVIGALGLFVNGIYYGIISKEKKLLRSIFFILIGAFLIQKTKIYVLLAILPATIVWIFFMYKERIKNDTLRRLASPLFFGLGAVGGVLFVRVLGSIFPQYTLAGFMEEAVKMQWWLKVCTERDGGTGYDLGTLDPTLWGLLKAFPKSVNVALFRPYLWEARKVIVIPSAFEALFTLGLTLYVIFKVGLRRILVAILSDPVVLFCMIFSIIFAFAVGFTSINFGALARYKIPCLPFYYIAMIVLLDKVPSSQPPPTPPEAVAMP